MTNPNEEITLLYDIELRRPACALLQALAGLDYLLMSRLFTPETWLVHPTPGMRLVRGTPRQWRMLVSNGCNKTRD